MKVLFGCNGRNRTADRPRRLHVLRRSRGTDLLPLNRAIQKVVEIRHDKE